MDLDRISGLPENVVNCILWYLPIKEAVRTSLLSTKWRYKYSKLSSLTFDDQSFPLPPGPERPEVTNKLVRLIDRVLLLHSGPIHEFELSLRHKIPGGEIEKWIVILSRHNLEDLAMCIPLGVSYRMPSSMFSCQSLINLELTSCVLKPPSTFKGFKNLRFLYLMEVIVDRDALESLISGSPLLQVFNYVDPYADHNICINAPNLIRLNVNTEFVRFDLKIVPRLTSFTMHVRYYKDGSYLKELLSRMPQIQTLYLVHESVKFISDNDVPGGIFIPLVNLRYLWIGLKLTHVKVTSGLFYLLKKAPNLQTLEIRSLYDGSLETSSKDSKHEDLRRPIISLRCVTISDFRGTKAEMDFIGFMLSILSGLKTMTIYTSAKTLETWCCGHQEAFEVMKQLVSFRRASPKAVIVLKDI